MKATVCRIFGTRRSTLVDSLTRIGWVLTSGETRLMRRQQLSEAQIAALISFVAEQIDVRPESIDDYLISGQNRRRHAAELQDRLRLRPFGRRPASELASSLLRHAMESDRLVVLAGLVIQECRQRGIVVPSPRSLERLCVDLRHQARREIERRLTGGLLAEQRRRLDALTERRAEGGRLGNVTFATAEAAAGHRNARGGSRPRDR